MPAPARAPAQSDRKSTRLNSSHVESSYAVFCLKKKNIRSVCGLRNWVNGDERYSYNYFRFGSSTHFLKFHDNLVILFFFFIDPATTEIYTLSLHDALPI